MPRQGPRRLPAGERDRRLAEEVLYLHSLWRSGGLAPAPIQPRSDRREQRVGRLDRALRRKEHKRRKVDHAAAAEPVLVPLLPASSREATEPVLVPLLPASSREAAEPVLVPLLPYSSREAFGPSAPSTANPPQPPSWLHFSNLDYDDHGGPDPGRDKEEEEEAASYFTGLFRRDALLRGHYTDDWRDGRFQCMVCTAGGAQKPPRYFRGCLALVQHARNPPRSWSVRYGRHGAHRALAAAVCRLLGWDSRATAGGQRAKKKKNGAGENNGSSTDDESYSIGEDEESDDDEESVDEEDIETGIPDPATDSDEEDSEIENDQEYAEKEDGENWMEDSSTDGDEDANELERSNEAGQKEAANSIARKRDMKISDHLLSLTHAKLVGALPKKTDIQKKSHVKEVSTPANKFYEGSGKAKRKASALSYQGQSSTSGVVKKVKVDQQPSNKGKQSNKTNETGASAHKAKRPAVAARKAKQLAKKQNETGASARKAKRPAVAARKVKQLTKKQLAKKCKSGLNS